MQYEELPAIPIDNIVSTRGAGDAFVAAAAWALSATAPQMTDDSSAGVRAAVHCGLRAARLALQTDAAVPALTQAQMAIGSTRVGERRRADRQS